MYIWENNYLGGKRKKHQNLSYHRSFKLLKVVNKTNLNYFSPDPPKKNTVKEDPKDLFNGKGKDLFDKEQGVRLSVFCFLKPTSTLQEKVNV